MNVHIFHAITWTLFFSSLNIYPMRIHQLVTFLLFLACKAAVDPVTFSEKLQNSAPASVKVFQVDLGRTVNGYNVIAYGLTSISPIPEKMELSSFISYPSSLITSLMHATDQNAYNVLQGYVISLLKVYEKDPYAQMVLKAGVVWLVPFLSIETLEFQIKEVGVGKINFANLSMKNKNKFPDHSQEIDCPTKFTGKYSGVNLNYNFLAQKNESFHQICENDYCGPHPHSEMETMAINKMFQSLQIKIVIDLQLGNDTWVYPYKEIWEKYNNYGNIYRDVLKKTKKANITMIEQPTISYMQGKSILNKYTGGFVNWAAIQGAVAFKYLISTDKQGDELLGSLANAYKVIDMLLKKNSPIYNKYRSSDSKKLYIQSVSTQIIKLRCQIALPGESEYKDYEIDIGNVVEIDVISNYLTSTTKPQIRLSLIGSDLQETVNIPGLMLLDDLAVEDFLRFKNRKFDFQYWRWVSLGLGIFSGIVVIMLMRINGLGSRSHHSFVRNEEAERFI